MSLPGWLSTPCRWLLRLANPLLAATAAALLLWPPMEGRSVWQVAVAAPLLAWPAWNAWLRLRAVNRAVSATAPGGALDVASRRALNLESLLTSMASRLDRLERLSDAREVDERHRHDGDVVAVLGALLDVNEAVRDAMGPPRGSFAYLGAEAGDPLPSGVRNEAEEEPS